MTEPGRRDAEIDAFLATTPWHTARRVRLGGDASFRRYERLEGGPGPAMLMDAPPPQEDVRPFVKIARHLTGLGLSAPAIHAEDADLGLLVIEDFGDATYTRRLATGQSEEDLYALAVESLIALHCAPSAAAVNVPVYTDEKLDEEALLLVDWFAPAALGAPLPDAARAEYQALWTPLFEAARAVPASLVLRDFHVDNLMWLPERHGVARCGLLDFQDAVTGPVTYDLMSLFEDARRDIAPHMIRALRAHYLRAFPDIDAVAFDRSFAILGAQRHAKVIGIFTRLCVRDAKPVYLEHIPRVWSLLEHATSHPALADVRAWLDSHIPKDRRGIPGSLADAAAKTAELETAT